MKLINNKIILIYALVLLTVISCKKDEEMPTNMDATTSKTTDKYDAEVAHTWMNMFSELTKKATGFSPPVASRAFGYAGHSVASGAAAKILTTIFGDNYAITDKTHEKRTDINGSPRSFKSFNDMASEAAISRLYGGIHYREAVEKEVVQGTRVGAELDKLQFKKQPIVWSKLG